MYNPWGRALGITTEKIRKKTREMYHISMPSLRVLVCRLYGKEKEVDQPKPLAKTRF